MINLLCVKCCQKEIDHVVLDHDYHYEPDKCQVCEGKRGGVKGNENIVMGIIVCDYCTSIWMDGGLDLSVYDKITDRTD